LIKSQARRFQVGSAYRKKRENILEGRIYIDGVSSILAAYEWNKFPFQISSEGVMILRETFVQMCNGLDPRTKDKQLAKYYINYILEYEAAGFPNAQ
jgi:hypothetical protein